jgi:hypothetical protein
MRENLAATGSLRIFTANLKIKGYGRYYNVFRRRM